MKYLEIHLTLDVQHMYTENYRTLAREIEGDLTKWRYILWAYVKRLNIKISHLFKLVYRFNTIPI